MIAGMYEQEFVALLSLGIFLNFILSFLFGLYMSNNIGMEEMINNTGERKQPWWMAYTLFVPYIKMIVTLYRVAVLQFYFLNQGKTHKDYWVYLTH